jgi:hypothetical protein
VFREGSNQLLLDAEGVAKSRAIDVTGYDVEWARPDRAPAREGIHELIRIRSSDIPRLVDDFYAYNFQMIDANHDLSDAELNELTLVARTREPGAQMLDRFAWASNYLDNHDACYLWQEARADDLLLATMSRALTNFIMASTQISFTVAAPSLVVLGQLIEPANAWTAPQEMVAVSEDAITLAFCRGGWKLGNELPTQAARILQYRFDAGTWEWLVA